MIYLFSHDRLVGEQEGGRSEKKEKEKRKGGLPVYRYRDSDLLSCIPLFGATCAAREESDVQHTPDRRKKKDRKLPFNIC